MTRYIHYAPSQWYWTVGGSTAQVWSSAAAAYVPASDAGYQAWLATGGVATALRFEDELVEVLTRESLALGALPGVPAPTCLLWQPEAICNDPPASLGFTPPTWPQVQAAVQAQASAALTAFFNVGTNAIPADSKTLLALAAAVPSPLTAAQVTALIAAAAAIAID